MNDDPTPAEVALINKEEIASGPLTEEQELYKENILDYYKNPRNKHELPEYTLCHREVNSLCGDVVTFFLKIDHEVVQGVSFTGTGCAISQAAASMLTEKIKNRSLSEVRHLTGDDVLKLLGIPISHLRLKCALLCLKAVMNGVEDYHR